METSIELGYAGVVIGRVTVSGEIDENGLFLPLPDPLPVGTRLNLKIDGRAADARVIAVSESAEPGKAGMKVRIGPAGAAAVPAAAVSAPVGDSRAPSAEAPAEPSDAHAGDGGGDGIPTADETAGNSGAVGGGGGRRRRRRR